MTSDATFTVTIDTTALDRACEMLAALGRTIDAMRAAVVRFAAALVRAFVVPLEFVRRHTVALTAVSEGWRGLALRHALRPPTRGYWAKRCVCQACGLRAFVRGAT